MMLVIVLLLHVMVLHRDAVTDDVSFSSPYIADATTIVSNCSKSAADSGLNKMSKIRLIHQHVHARYIVLDLEVGLERDLHTSAE